MTAQPCRQVRPAAPGGEATGTSEGRVRAQLSVVVCTHNGEPYVRQQLDSILRQDRAPDEVLVFDDCSSDATAEAVRSTANQTKIPLDLVVNDRVLGVIGNFSRAIAACTGSIIVLADQDDVWEPDKLAAIERAFAASPGATAVFSDASLIAADGRPTHRTLWQAHGLGRRECRRLVEGDVLSQLLRWNVVTGATLAFRSELVPKLLPIPSHLMHDYWIALLAAVTGDVIAIPQPLIRYRIHHSNAVGVPSRRPLALMRARAGDDGERGNELALFEAVLARTEDLASPETTRALQAKIAFLAARCSLSSRPRSRLATVMSALRHGTYHRLAHGWRSAAHDAAFGR